MTGRAHPDTVSTDANQAWFKNGLNPHAQAVGAKQARARSSAASSFGMALHYRCNLLVRGACGNRQAGCHRPSGQCAGTHEKGPPHLSRSCVVRVGGRNRHPAFRAINQMSPKKGCLYHADTATRSVSRAALRNAAGTSFDLWHRRQGSKGGQASITVRFRVTLWQPEI